MRNAVVVDSSIVVKWVLDEPDSNMAIALLTRWAEREFVLLAPALLTYEITNVLHRRVLSKEISLDKAKNMLEKVILSELVFDFSKNPALSTRAIELANQFGLPATYDAYYLALAEREGCELWTADKRFWNSIQGKLDWVHWIGSYSSGG